MYKRLGVVLTLAFFAGCSSSGGNAPSLPQSASQPGALPDVYQRGTPPVTWEKFNPITEQGDDTVYSWPLVDDKTGGIDFGDSCCYPAGDPPRGSVEAMNYSGSLTTYGEHVNFAPGYFTVSAPVKAFQCAGGTQVCLKGAELLNAPNNVQYYFGSNHGLKDAAAGAGNLVYATVYGGVNEIVSGNNGTKASYALPNPKDAVQSIVVATDGNVWVTLQNYATKAWSLARLAPGTGHITAFNLQLPNSPLQLLVGPDRNIWFALAKTLYRVNYATAQLTRFALPQTANGYLNLGAGATMWVPYVNSLSSQGLMEVSDSGTVLGTFACPSSVCSPGSYGNQIQQATYGADGNVWFAFSHANVFIGGNPPPNTDLGIGVYVVHAISVTPASLTFTGAGKTQTIAFSEAQYSGTFTVSSTSAGVVRVVKMVTPHEAEVQSVAKGSARIIIRDTMNNYYGVSVTVQ